MSITGSPAAIRSPTLLSISATSPVTSVLASILAICVFPRLARLSQSGAGRPAAHEMLPDSAGHAQPMHVEHADQVVARRVRLDDRLHGVEARDVPGLAILVHLRKGSVETRLTRRKAVHDIDGERRVHEGDF